MFSGHTAQGTSLVVAGLQTVHVTGGERSLPWLSPNVVPSALAETAVRPGCIPPRVVMAPRQQLLRPRTQPRPPV